MKTLAKGILTTLFLILTIVVFGQKGVEDGSKYGHGEDSIRCIKNMSLYREYVKQKSYDIALDSWKIVYTECPKASLYTYIDGIKMIKSTIRKTEDQAQKNILVDSMMRIYDKRIKYFNKKGFVLGNKGLDLIKYSENTVETRERGYGYLKESIELQKYKSKASQLLTFMQTSKYLFTADIIDGGQVVTDYGMVIEIAEYIIANKKKGYKNVIKAKPSVDQVFETSGAATCEDLIPFYTAKFAETPEDTEFLKKSISMLRATKCTDSDFFFEISKKLNSIEPTATLAYELARTKNQAEKLDESVIYYKQAIELEVEDLQKAKYYLELADVTRRLGDYPQARTYALKSIEFDTTSGLPYIIIGNIYAASCESCAEKEFEQKAVYWAAVDKFVKAKKVDPELTDDANKYIEAYKAHFPDNETIFFYGFKQGDSYTVECWINEKTTVRAR